MASVKLALQRVLREDIGYVCVLVDGLDEYSGDLMESIQLLRSLLLPKLKICISSRPWVVFEDAFTECPQLRLQDLNREDIKIYVNDTLCENDSMRILYKNQPLEAPKLVDEIVVRANGVFPWVTLVTKSLLRGLMNHDEIIDLQHDFNQCPLS